MWYGYVGPKLGGVTTKYSLIEHVIKKIPYATWRSFRDEDSAWAFVGSRRHNYVISGINKYGDIFANLYATLEYFVRDTGVYANLRTEKLGFIRLGNLPDDVRVEYKAKVIKLHIPIFNLSNDALDSHAIALYTLFGCIGPIIDVEVIVDTFSVFYMLTQYTGKRYIYQRTIKALEQRTGHVAYTIKSKVAKMDDSEVE